MKCKYCDNQWIYQFWLLDRNHVNQVEATVCREHFDIAKGNQEQAAFLDYWEQYFDMMKKLRSIYRF